MPNVYNRLGVQFEYPENWTVEDEGSHADYAAVSVASPGGAFWSLTIHPASADLYNLIDTVLDCLREEYRDLESEPIEERIAGWDVVGYDVNFFCMDLTNTAMIRAVQTPRATYLLLCQAEDREFVLAGPVFLAMTLSLLQGDI
jgi:hypothetical protein